MRALLAAVVALSALGAQAQLTPSSACNGAGRCRAALVPTTDAAKDLGSSTFQWRDTYASRTATVGTKLWVGTPIAQSQGEGIAVRSTNPGIGFYHSDLVDKNWDIFLEQTGDRLEFNTLKDDGTNVQSHCTMSVRAGDPDLSCGVSGGRIETPNFLATFTTSPQLGLFASANAVNQKRYRIIAQSASVDFDAINDTQNATTTFLRAVRSGAGDGSVVDSLRVPATTFAVGSGSNTPWNGTSSALEVGGEIDLLASGAGGVLTDSPVLRFIPSTSAGASLQMNRKGALDANEVLHFRDQNGNEFAALDFVGKTLTMSPGVSGAASVAAFSAPTCALNAGTPSTCTATVPSGVRCTCSLQSSTLSLAVGCAVSGTTATAAAAAAATGTIQFTCF